MIRPPCSCARQLWQIVSASRKAKTCRHGKGAQVSTRRGMDCQNWCSHESKQLGGGSVGFFVELPASSNSNGKRCRALRDRAVLRVRAVRQDGLRRQVAREAGHWALALEPEKHGERVKRVRACTCNYHSFAGTSCPPSPPSLPPKLVQPKRFDFAYLLIE